jgi:hypothetical protein
MEVSQCAPAHQYGYTCLPKRVLVALAESYNRKRNGNINYQNMKKIDIHKAIREKMSGECKTEICILNRLGKSSDDIGLGNTKLSYKGENGKRKYIKSDEIDTITDNSDKLITDYSYDGFADTSSDESDYNDTTYNPVSEGNWINRFFKPVRPKGSPTRWLSTLDINHVLKQYEEKYPDFEFIGPVPIDFDLVFRELREFSLKKMLHNGKNKIGIVFNLDPHDKSGSHWVALYFEFSDRRNEISFFDSYGVKPHTNIKTFMNRIADQAKHLRRNPFVNVGGSSNLVKINENTVRHQYKNSECGVYSINFILENLTTDKSFNQIVNEIKSDDLMVKYREIYFRP